MEKRVTFRSAWLPWVLLAPQVAIIAVFFFWPAGQALVQSFQQQDAFGTSVQWAGLENFRNLFNDETYLASFRVTAEFSILVAVFGKVGSQLRRRKPESRPVGRLLGGAEGIRTPDLL